MAAVGRNPIPITPWSKFIAVEIVLVRPFDVVIVDVVVNIVVVVVVYAVVIIFIIVDIDVVIIIVYVAVVVFVVLTLRDSNFNASSLIARKDFDLMIFFMCWQISSSHSFFAANL